MKPTAEQQLQFLQHLQQLFEEGDFVATYKYALLMSLAELAVESDVGEGELELPMVRVAEKFAELYWPQTLPYVSGLTGSSAELLAQNQGKQAAVVNALSVLRSQGAATISQAMRLPYWAPTIRSIARTVAQMPVKYLQNVGSIQVVFLYDYPNPPGKIVLKHGVAFMLRTFHPLIQQLARSGWVRHVRENTRNAAVIGQADELESLHVRVFAQCACCGWRGPRQDTVGKVLLLRQNDLFDRRCRSLHSLVKISKRSGA